MNREGTTKPSLTPDVFINNANIDLIGNVNLNLDQSCMIAENVSEVQFDRFVVENKGKHFRLREGNLFFDFKQGPIHSKVAREISNQITNRLGEEIVDTYEDVNLNLGPGNIEYPDVQVLMMERIYGQSQMPNMVCEVAYSNQTLEELHQMTNIYFNPIEHNDIIAYLAIKVSYPSYAQQPFQMLAILYLRDTNDVPVQIWSCGSAPVTEAVMNRLSELTGLPPGSPEYRGYGINMEQPPNAQNADSYRIPIPDNVFLMLHANDTLERFVGQAIPQYGFHIDLYPIYNQVHRALTLMRLQGPAVVRNVSNRATVEHLADHILPNNNI